MSDDSVLSLLFGGLTLYFIFYLTFLIISFIGLSKIFKKAGVAGWKAFIPFYNIYMLINISGLNKYYFCILFLSFFPHIYIISFVANTVLYFFIFYNLAIKFNKEPILYACLSILFPHILFLVFGFSKSYTFNGDIVVSQHGPLKIN